MDLHLQTRCANEVVPSANSVLCTQVLASSRRRNGPPLPVERRLYIEDIRKRLFQTPDSSNASSASTEVYTAVHVELPVVTHSTHEDSSFWRDSRSKKTQPLRLHNITDMQIDKEKVGQSTSEVIGLLYARRIWREQQGYADPSQHM